ncbi:MAG: hypothetical protein AB1349_02645 [Elusimicrobiota bacterium]
MPQGSSFAILDGSYSIYKSKTTGLISYNEIVPYAPKTKFNISLNHLIGKFRTTLSANYTSKQYTSWYYLYYPENYTLLEKTVCNLGLIYSPNIHLDISVKIENLSDEKYKQPYEYLISPRTISAETVFRF